MPLVVAAETMPVRTVGAKGEPQRVLAGAVINVRLNLGATRLAIGKHPMETIREQVGAVGAKHHNRWKLRTVGDGGNVLGDDVVVDG